MTQFSTKWGLYREELSSRQLKTIMVVQLITTILILAITRPRLILDSNSLLRVPQLSVVKILVISSGVVALTYGYPYLVRC